MKPQVHNLRRRFDARGALVLLPALGAMLLAAGITAPRAVQLAGLRADAVRAQAQAQECARLREDVQAFSEAGGVERALAATAAVRAAFPVRCSTTEMHSAVRLAAARCALELSRLNVSEPRVLELPGDGDPLAQRSIEILGHGSFASLSNLVRTLAAHGYPARVQSLSLTRESAHSSRFEVHATLALFHSVEFQAPRPEASLETTQEE